DAFDLTALRERFTLDKANPDGSQQMLDCTQRYYTCPELRWLLRQVGFRRVEFFACSEGGYDRNLKPASAHFEFGIIAEK
ncbi:MAG: hypothetical protein GXP38_15500, partial [Chloroflexi bacterium]|nr:hypothetical protein [Chloroflexota bacterium]